MTTRCERCTKSISSHQSQRTATGYACKRNTACWRAWRRTHPPAPVEHTTTCVDCGVAGPYRAMVYVRPFCYVCQNCSEAAS
jgi:hypothetical protein